MLDSLYSLWLIPPKDVSDKLLKIIKNLSIKYNAPIFYPHITLLGDINCSKNKIINLTQKIAKSVKPFNVKFSKIENSDSFFRCVYIKILECNELLQLNNVAKIYFNKVEEFMPHLSLLYGDYNVDIRHEIVSSLNIVDSFVIENLVLTNSSQSKSIDEWKIIKKFSLGK